MKDTIQGIVGQELLLQDELIFAVVGISPRLHSFSKTVI